MVPVLKAGHLVSCSYVYGYVCVVWGGGCFSFSSFCFFLASSYMLCTCISMEKDIDMVNAIKNQYGITI